MKQRIFAGLLVVALPVALALILRNVSASLSWLLVVALAVLGGCIFISIILSVILHAKKRDSKNIRSKLFELKDNFDKTYNKRRFSIGILHILSCMYLGIYLCAVPMLSVGLILKGLELYSESVGAGVGIFVITIILLVYEFFVFAHSFQPISYNYGPHIRLYHNNTPRIWSLCDSAMRRLGFRKPVLLLAVPGGNASIIKHKRFIQIMIGYELLQMLKPEELHSIFLHEFSHVLQRDLEYSRRINSSKDRWQLLSTRHKLFPSFLFSPIGALFINTSTLFDFVASYHIEMETDAKITGDENRKNLVNALAKIDLYSYYKFKLPLENAEKNTKEPKHNFIDAGYKKFVEAYFANKEQWDEVIKKQLPARIDTHPNLAERMQNFGIDSFLVDFDNFDNVYLKEVENLQETIVEAINESPSRKCEQKYQYDIFEDIIADAKSNPSEDFLQLIDVAKAYFVLCNYDKALKLYEKVLELDSANPEALLHKGIILCDRRDNEGMQYLLELLDNNNYFERAYICLVMYIQYQALKDEKERLRELIYSKSDNYLDSVLMNTGKTFEHKLEQDKLEKIKALVLNEPSCGHVLLLRKQHKKIDYHYLIISVNSNVFEKQSFVIERIIRQLSKDCKELIVRLIPHSPLPKNLNKSKFILKSDLKPINDKD